MHYSLLFLFFGSALLIFLYLAFHKKLGIDEEAKYQMLEGEDE